MDATGPYRERPRGERPIRSGEYDCPACATRVRDDVRACPRCGAPIASVRCAECFHMNVPEAALCLGCGHELGLEPVGVPDALECPDCKLPLTSFSGAGGLLRDCRRCGGQFVEHALVEALLAQREIYGAAAPKRPQKQNPLDSPVRYVRCPACREVMTRKNFGQSSGIIVDVCRHDGIWFDAGELPRVLAFVEAGGLELARRRDEQEQLEAERRERVREASRELGKLSEPVSAFEPGQGGALLAEARALLLDFVRGLTRRQ